eukprot:TRINITY_DN3623_c0_g1_i3.p1 TRINITY_DN3623_c0_g1~~TRINITY_DN3623_c0_g1_i3.p1  ORF type:complete len:295 (+),score=53.77 TRINITY_DN3623_c0_g1_i3:630-1514(+)
MHNVKFAIAGGVESMSTNPRTIWDDPQFKKPEVTAHAIAKNLYLTMGQTAEVLTKRYGVDRKRMDQISADSHRRAHEATKSGKFDQEIVPVRVEKSLEKTETSHDTAAKVYVEVKQDEGIRPETNVESLGKLKPVFSKDGSTTAGNSSQLSDGAAAVLMMRRSTADELGFDVLGTFRSYSVVGVPPEVMGIGPVAAIPALLKNAGITKGDVSLFEINEAFATQVLCCVDQLGLDWSKVNVNGGAIALGHPLGCSGVRIALSLLNEMKRRNVRYGVASLCAGSGMGAAALFESSF